MSEMIIKEKIEGKEVSVSLNQNEVATALSICEKNSVEEVIVMKRPHKGGALFFTDPSKAAACQDRHGFDLSFKVKKSELKKFKPENDPPPPVDKRDAEITTLKEKLKEANAAADPKIGEEIGELNKVIGDKDAEIELLADANKGISEASTKLVAENAALKEEVAKLKK